MSIVVWLVFGLIAGFISSKIVNRRGSGAAVDLLLGIVGALVGGLIANATGATGITGFNMWSLFVAVMGAVLVLVAYHAIAGRRVI